MLEISGLYTAYGQAEIINDLSIKVDAGECVALLGRNGAGKSTLMKSIMGVVTPKAGKVMWKGEDIVSWPNYKTAHAAIGFVPEERRIFPDLTVLENLIVGEKAKDKIDTPWTIERVYALFPKLEELANRLGGQLSGGEQQMLTVARSLMGNPELLLLDEPTEGLAPIIVQQMVSAMRSLKEQGLSIIVSEQNINAIAPLCDRVYILEKGLIVHEGTIDDLKKDPALVEKHLGAL